MSTFCNTTSGPYPIFHDLILVGHDHAGFFPPDPVTGDITCACGWRVSRAELTALAEAAVASKAAA